MNLSITDIKRVAKETRNGEVRLKLRLFALVLSGVRVEDACVRLHVTVSYYYFWLRRFKKFKFRVKGLEKYSTRPKQNPNRKSHWIVYWVKYYRLQKHYGAERIQAYLRLDHHILISISSLNRILKRQNLIGKRKRLPSKKHLKRYELSIAGERMQLDVKYLPYQIKGRKYYVYNIIDKASRWSYKRAFDSFGPSNTVMFLDDVLRHCPFPIQLIQTDNGVEFTNKFISQPIYNQPTEHAMDRWCRENNIRHKLNPVGEKELNGCVERSHRTDDIEFYSFHQARSYEELNDLLKAYYIDHNDSRRYKPLGWRAPNQWLIEQALAYLVWIKIKFNLPQNKTDESYEMAA